MKCVFHQPSKIADVIEKNVIANVALLVSV